LSEKNIYLNKYTYTKKYSLRLKIATTRLAFRNLVSALRLVNG